MLGYNAFNEDLTCMEFQYEIGGTYKLDGEPIPCERGFHFCKSIPDVYNYYLKDDSTRVCKVEATGDIKTDDNVKYCTNEIKILEEITEDYIRRGNTTNTSTGFCNSGDYNSGHWNSGDNNTGNHNSGNHNSGDRNNGNWNTGNCNSGNCNTGDYSNGLRNSGNFNSGDYYTGNQNTGVCNSGNHNTGNYNSGNRNTGNCNSGDWNKTDYSSGCFNTEKETIRMFNKPTNITLDDWFKMEARSILNRIPKNTVKWIDYEDMTDEEKLKENYFAYKTTGGYLKVLDDEKDSAQLYWDGLSDDDKRKILSENAMKVFNIK
jgi:hypothetical protein